MFRLLVVQDDRNTARLIEAILTDRKHFNVNEQIRLIIAMSGSKGAGNRSRSFLTAKKSI